ncbi:peptidoglycan D,D-transpeptidase FtsI family protein [Bacillus infantis]|uniref:serine-type D-Ala-D-Ala carboxypeptidase n=1 Tax=Bacillus infantis TaxID=324767 RepID=A0A5D4SS76_9BACI|nr:penicillin-binding transpeptidase domain-containing protein [Bacillus infantis]MCP1159882.1 penicillin-binding transpeptidase domain-containing protein [Bacillus infantis]TYS66220.1 penicillin-binding protein 2 [Bacillus infantis]
MWKKRAIIVISIFMLGIVLLIGRLIQIQLVSAEHFSAHNINLLDASVRQRSQEMVIDSGRGSFLDRNGEPLTHQEIPVLVLFPFLKNMDWDSQKVASITGISETALLYSIKGAKEPFAYGKPKPLELTDVQAEQINSLKIPGVFAVEKKYSLANNLAEQLIGITGQNKEAVQKRYPGKNLPEDTVIGVSGLEESFDEFLMPDGESKLVYHVDAAGGPLFGINVKYVEPANPFYPVNIKTTLDAALQEEAERLADVHGIRNGGMVLLDIENNTVLAMVSRPQINKTAPYKDGGLVNAMIKQQIIGSVFKTVVAAAAIDYNLDSPERQFDCSRKINGQPDTVYQHGMLNFTDSFARSCNNTFATIAKELKEIDPAILEDYAGKLSLTGKSGWEGDIYHFTDFHQLAREDEGRVFYSEDAKKDSNFVALTGIGQHEVRATPLGVANMMATIAKGGKKESIRVASEIEYKNETSLLKFPSKDLGGGKISPYTAMKLQKLLREVVVNEEGTGRWFKELPYSVAGKSGTAETGQFDDGEQLHNKWFAGYFPYEKPKYALVAVNLGVKENEGGVNPLFADMVKAVHGFDEEME